MFFNSMGTLGLQGRGVLVRNLVLACSLHVFSGITLADDAGWSVSKASFGGQVEYFGTINSQFDLGTVSYVSRVKKSSRIKRLLEVRLEGNAPDPRKNKDKSYEYFIDLKFEVYPGLIKQVGEEDTSFNVDEEDDEKFGKLIRMTLPLIFLTQETLAEGALPQDSRHTCVLFGRKGSDYAKISWTTLGDDRRRAVIADNSRPNRPLAVIDFTPRETDLAQLDQFCIRVLDSPSEWLALTAWSKDGTPQTRHGWDDCPVDPNHPRH